MSSTPGLVLGAVVLAIGLVLILLPVDYESNGAFTVTSNEFVPNPSGTESAGLLQVPVPSEQFALGGASISVTWQVLGSQVVTAFLYTETDAVAVQNGGPSTQGVIASDGVAASAGSLTASSLSPGTTYGVLFILSSGTVNINVSATWSGSMFLPYALLGIPLAITGAIVLVATVAFSRPRPTSDDASSVYAVEADGGRYDQGYPAVLEGTTVAPAVAPTIARPTPQALPAPSSGVVAAPLASPSVGGPYADPRAPSGWRARPMGRLGGERSRVVPQSEIAHGRPNVVGGTDATELGTSGEALLGPAGPESRVCPKCQLLIPEDTWAFCPRCRAELD